MTDRNELRRLAQAAANGNWYVGGYCHIYSDIPVNDGEEEWDPLIAVTDDDETSIAYENNAAFIAAANPAVVLELLDEIERLRAICTKAKEALYAGTLDDFEVAEMLEAATPGAQENNDES